MKKFLILLLTIFSLNCSYGQILVPQKGSNEKWGFVDEAKGQVIIPFKYDIAEGFVEGLAAVCYEKWGFIDKNDSVIIPFEYEWVDHFTGGIAKATLNGKTGFIDKNGEIAIPFKYDFVVGFTLGNRFASMGLSMVGLDGNYGFIDKTGKEVIPIRYTTTEEAVREVERFIQER